jgi:hypothetical protein
MANKSEAQQGRGVIHLEFTGAESRTLTVELLFDGFEQSKSVAGQVANLESMASVIEPTSQDENRRRPHHCVVAWGDRGLPSFRCVIESLSTKYTMFDSDGTPLRATCTVKLKEADMLTLASDQSSSPPGGGNGKGSGNG